MKNWEKSNEIELFEKINQEQNKNIVEISCTSDRYNDCIYLVKFKKQDAAIKMINEFEKKILSILDENDFKAINEIKNQILNLEEKYNQEIKNLNDKLTEKIENIKVSEEIDYSPYFKDFAKKIDIISKKVFKIEEEMVQNKIRVQRVAGLPSIKKEVRLQQKLAKSSNSNKLN